MAKEIYLVCSLNDENYTEPSFEFCNTLDKAKEICVANVCEYYNEKGMEMEMEFETNEHSYRYDYSNEEGEFYVNEIIPITATNGNSLCIWHHAYDGVDFKVLKVGTESECIAFMQKDAKETFYDYGNDSDFDESEFTSETDICFDTGNEWEMWSIVKYKEEEK